MTGCKHLFDDEKISQPPITQSDGTFAVPGCCGGGCYIISEIVFCPFCGELIAKQVLK